MAHSLPSMLLRVTDANGRVLPGALLHVYLAGTLTETPVYTTADLDVTHPNPVEADDGGLLPAIYFAPGDYKLVYASAADVEVGQRDNYSVVTAGGDSGRPVYSKTANFTVTADARDGIFLVDASAAPGLNINCSADSDELGVGFEFTVVNVGATGQCTVLGIGAQTVSGDTELIISTQNASVSFASIGAAGWQSTSKDGVSSSSTDVLEGTNTTLAVTPAGNAALWKKGSAITGGSTITIDDGGLFSVSGNSWTCTDIDFTVPTDGRAVELVISGTGNKFTNSLTLACPGGRDLYLEAGDSVFVRQFDGDTVRVSNPVRATQMGGKTLLNATTVASGTEFFVDLSAYPEHRDFEVVLSGMTTAATAALRMQMSTDGGATYLSDATYQAVFEGIDFGQSASALKYDGGPDQTYWVLHYSTIYTGGTADIDFKVCQPASTARRPSFYGRAFTTSGSGPYMAVGQISGFRDAAADITHLRIFTSASTVSGGRVFLYGLGS